jgi:predicted dehydrogenase
MKLSRKLRMGMVDGGVEAFIGGVHRKAALMYGHIEFSACALSATKERYIASARELLLPNNRSYGSWEEMLEKESALPQDQKIDFVTIVTPNYLRFPIAKSFAEAGFHIICDKPMT